MTLSPHNDNLPLESGAAPDLNANDLLDNKTETES
jgi:hypothetical protein